MKLRIFKEHMAPSPEVSYENARVRAFYRKYKRDEAGLWVENILMQAARLDIPAGLLLNGIVRWFHPHQPGASEVRVYRHGYDWLAKQRSDWLAEIWLSPKEVDRAARVLADLGLIKMKVMRFHDVQVPHYRLTVNLIDILDADPGDGEGKVSGMTVGQLTDSPTVTPGLI